MESKAADNTNNNAGGSDILSNIGLFFVASARATWLYIKNLPMRTVNFFGRKINERKNRPPRKDISKVYVLVGYTNKKNVDEKFNAERNMIILRRGLLIIIFLLLLFIMIDRVVRVIKFDELQQMFGISGWSQFVSNDPFDTGTATVADESVAESIVATPVPEN